MTTDRTRLAEKCPMCLWLGDALCKTPCEGCTRLALALAVVEAARKMHKADAYLRRLLGEEDRDENAIGSATGDWAGECLTFEKALAAFDGGRA